MKRLYLLLIVIVLIAVGCKKKVESIDIYPQTIELNADNHESYLLKAVIVPQNATNKISWSSSDPHIATVSNNGLVQSENTGECIINARAGNKTAACRVKVNHAANILQSIHFTDENISIHVGQTEKLNYSVTPRHLNPQLAWASSDNNIINVSQTGFITAVSEGKATVTASHKGIKDACTITVNSTSVSLDQTDVTLNIGDQIQLTATTTPVIPASFIQWTSYNTTVAQVDNTGMVTAVAPGNALIKASVGQTEATCTIHVSNSTGSMPASAPRTHSHLIP
ncbi:MAG: Ig-like domain-containing protein [Bacteroidales bacterium]|nr:Ig-like domain-containing protein [Bacteroidales bacterium]